MILVSTRAGADSPEGKTNRDKGVITVSEHGVASITDGMLAKVVSPATLTSNPGLIHNLQEIMLETSVNGVKGALQGMRDRPDSTALLAQVHCPTLVIHGADDQLIPVTEAEMMHQQIGNSSLVVIPQAGHLVNMEQPGAFNQAVRRFIESIPQSR
jgi:pimeloyl-ACP methyl ester carboxylesterase